MKVLVDTSVWSAILRRKAPNLNFAEELQRLTQQGRLRIIGPIRQEVLAGIANAASVRAGAPATAALSRYGAADG